MSAVDDVISAVNQSEKLSPEVKELVTAFLQAGSPAIEGLASDAIGELMQVLGARGGSGGTDLVAAGLSETQVTAAATEAAGEMKDLADQKQAAAAQTQATIAALGDAALSVLAKALISAL